MPKSPNTVTTETRVANREELSDIVDLTDRKETPIYSMIGNTGASSVAPEWTVETLDAPERDINSEGRDYAFTEEGPNERFKNHTQIFEKEGKYSNTQEAVSNAGNSETIARAKVRKGIALKRNIEFSLVDNLPSLGGEDRQSGSLVTWAETNVSRGAGGNNGGYNPATQVTIAPTPATAQRAFTRDILDDLLQAGFTSGARLEHMFLSPWAKRVFASFMSDPAVAQFRYDAKDSKGGKNTLVADAEVYMGPLGMVYAHHNFVMGANADIARNVIVLDVAKVKWAWLRKVAEDKGLAKTGDYKKFVLQGEGCVKPLNEKAVGVVADIFGLNAAA